jgi:predicted glutamine amidotransferase
MCALFGWYKPAFGRGVDKKRLLRHLARKSQSYGNKSFGIAAIIDGKVEMSKYTGAASQWLAQNEKELKKWADPDIVLGHTRLPTQGAVTKNNCHPFQFGPWVAAHNGMISNSSELMMQAVYVAKGETDSEEALTHAATYDFSKEALEDIEGSFAYEAVKEDGSELILVCDGMRSLYAVQIGEGVVWCTDVDALESSLFAAGAGRMKAKKIESAIVKFPGGALEKLERTFTYHYPGMRSTPSISKEAVNEIDAISKAAEKDAEEEHRLGHPSTWNLD